jgi:hypothetical protein
LPLLSANYKISRTESHNTRLSIKTYQDVYSFPVDRDLILLGIPFFILMAPSLWFRNYRIQTWYLVPVMLVLFASAACHRQEKSELVRRLESIFYDSSFARVPDTRFRVTDYGTAGDGRTLDTEAIQRAIDAASGHGGGVVVVPPGTYLSGAIFLKSNVELRLEKGAVIRAIQDDAAFPDIWTRVAGIEMYWPAGLINIYGQENVRITGKGTIDGNGKYWWDKFWGDPPRSGGMWTRYNELGIRWAVDYDCKRVRALVVYDSKDVLLRDFTIERSGFWTVTLTYCERVHVDGIVVRNNIGGYGPSSDGINTDSSRDILVEHCDIDCNDDNLCVKSGRDADGLRVNRPAENIVYRNSITRAGHGLFTLGSETSGGMRNIEVYGLRGVGTNTGIRFKSARVRGGTIEHIWFHDIEMEGVTTPIHFELDWYPSYSYPEIPASFPADAIPEHWLTLTTPVTPPERGIPQFQDIRISRVTATGAGVGFHVNAFPEKPISRVHLEQVHLEAKDPGFIHHAREWTMEGVSLVVEGDKPLELRDCVGVEEPRYIFLHSRNPTDAMEPGAEAEFRVPESMDETGRILVFADRSEPLEEGDTAGGDPLRIVVLPGEPADFTFSEPLGDGFYYSPVQIRWDQTDQVLLVTGEVNHRWIIYIRSQEEPEEVTGGDHWEFLPVEAMLVVQKSGTSFSVNIN